jgi:DNA-binding NarL/FixJ family response regulator
VAYSAYNNPDQLKTYVEQIVNSSDLVIDPLLEYKTDLHNQLKTTNQIIQTNFSHLSKDDILYLQLNAAGFDKRMIAKLMHKSESAIKKHYEKLSDYFKVNSSAELMTISLGKGIAKLAKYY